MHEGSTTQRSGRRANVTLKMNQSDTNRTQRSIDSAYYSEAGAEYGSEDDEVAEGAVLSSKLNILGDSSLISSKKARYRHRVNPLQNQYPYVLATQDSERRRNRVGDSSVDSGHTADKEL